MYRSNFAAELCRHRNNTVAIPGFSCPNPITRPFDTETDSDPDPDLASPFPSSAPLRESSPSGEPPAEDAVACSTWPWAWVGAMR
ncbi:MAG: hypothetical protein ACOX52_07015 [Verrucomicrobiota bacterium]